MELTRIRRAAAPAALRALVVLLLLSSLAAPDAAAQSDHGDAPDGDSAGYAPAPGVTGEFPTLPFTSNTRFPGNVGIEHDETGYVWLGGAASVTTLEAVPLVTDLDVDDSGAFWWISLTGIPAGATLDVPITISDDAPPGPYFLNVLIDQNNDGEWRDLPSVREWAVRDRPVDQAPGTTMRHSVPVWWSSNLIVLPKWVRITVTATPIAPLMAWGSDGWDGSMPPGSPLALAVGETEDRFVGATYPGTAGPGGGPLPGPAGGGVVGGPGGGANGKGLGGPLAPGGGGGQCLMSIDCGPENLYIPCGETGTVTCEIRYLSGDCPDLFFGCNAVVAPKFVAHLRGAGPRAIVTPAWDCTHVGPGADRLKTLSFSVTFPPPCEQQIARKQRWRFDLEHDPEGVYGVVGPDELEGIILSSTTPTCGNGIPQPPFEACDDGNLVAGDLCAPDCQFPSYVPNGILGPGEECDDGNAVSGDGCSSFGIREYCGNAVVDPHEACDDGNRIDGDGCNRFCQPETAPPCGNGSIDHVLEQCDDGNTTDGDGCDAYCQIEMCGDGALDAGEQCDDGNTADGDGCDGACQSEGACGNGWLDPGEGCDDGNSFAADCCDGCQPAAVRVAGLRLAEDRASIAWDPVIAPLRRYDLLRGDLAELRASSGGLDGAASTCLGTALATEGTADGALPSPGAAFFYVVRSQPGWMCSTSWEPGGPAPGANGQRDAASTACD